VVTSIYAENVKYKVRTEFNMPGNPGQIPKYVNRYVIKYHVLLTVNFLSDEVTRCCKKLCSTCI